MAVAAAVRVGGKIVGVRVAEPEQAVNINVSATTASIDLRRPSNRSGIGFRRVLRGVMGVRAGMLIQQVLGLIPRPQFDRLGLNVRIVDAEELLEALPDLTP